MVEESLEYNNGDSLYTGEGDSSINSSSNPPASLSLSEDSDTARIYDIKTMETRFEKRAPVKAVSPDTLKFFAPKVVPVFNKSPEVDVPLTEKREKEVTLSLCVDKISTMKSFPPSLPGDLQCPTSNVDLINRIVIEDDVLPQLPSVKKLVSEFASKSTPPQDSPVKVSGANGNPQKCQ